MNLPLIPGMEWSLVDRLATLRVIDGHWDSKFPGVLLVPCHQDVKVVGAVLQVPLEEKEPITEEEEVLDCNCLPRVVWIVGRLLGDGEAGAEAVVVVVGQHPRWPDAVLTFCSMVWDRIKSETLVTVIPWAEHLSKFAVLLLMLLDLVQRSLHSAVQTESEKHCQWVSIAVQKAFAKIRKVFAIR